MTHTDRLELFDRCRRLAFRIARRLFADDDRRVAFRLRGHDLEDVEQTALASIWKATRTYDQTRGLPSTYCYRSASRACFDLLQRRVRTIEHHGDRAGAVVDPRATDPADLLHVKLLGARVRVELAKLSPDLQALLQAIAEGETQTSIADGRGCSRQNVQQQTQRGLQQLRDALAERAAA